MLLQLRKEENDLRIIGIGVIVFGLWNAAKAFLFEFLPNTQRAVVRADILEENVPVWVYFGGIFIAVLIDTLLRLKIGRSALAESRGEKAGSLYLVITLVMTILYTIAVISDILGDVPQNTEIADRLVKLVVDLTSTALLLDLFLSAIHVRMLRKQLQQKEGSQ